MVIKQLLIAVDQFINVLFGGWADETISSRLYRTESRAVKYIDRIFFWEKEHCRQSYLSELSRKQFPPEFRGNP